MFLHFLSLCGMQAGRSTSRYCRQADNRWGNNGSQHVEWRKGKHNIQHTCKHTGLNPGWIFGENGNRCVWGAAMVGWLRGDWRAEWASQGHGVTSSPRPLSWFLSLCNSSNFLFSFLDFRFSLPAFVWIPALFDYLPSFDYLVCVLRSVSVRLFSFLWTYQQVSECKPLEISTQFSFFDFAFWSFDLDTSANLCHE